MSDAESKILEKIHENCYRKYDYEHVIKLLEKHEKNPTLIFSLIVNLPPALRSLGRYFVVTPEEEQAFIRKHELRALDCYQSGLEKNYEMLRQYKETGVEPEDFGHLVMTVDKDGNPKRTRVVDVVHGEPVFDDGCQIKMIDRKMNTINSLLNDLHKFMKKSGTLQEKLDKAMKLREEGKLGAQTPPSPNYDLDGLVGGLLDAAAWQNYAIEMGMVRTVNYDRALEELIECLEASIEFYKQATSIV